LTGRYSTVTGLALSSAAATLRHASPCKACSAGRFTKSAGASACPLCPKGRYRPIGDDGARCGLCRVLYPRLVLCVDCFLSAASSTLTLVICDSVPPFVPLLGAGSAQSATTSLLEGGCPAWLARLGNTSPIRDLPTATDAHRTRTNRSAHPLPVCR
jgi:hypothetical protein